jgi:NhaP-type Na+/H+ and K+/H+ antiporter
MVGKPLSTLTLPKGTLISTIVHLGETIIPRGTSQIEPGDTVIAVGLREAMDQLEAELSGALEGTSREFPHRRQAARAAAADVRGLDAAGPGVEPLLSRRQRVGDCRRR